MVRAYELDLTRDAEDVEVVILFETMVGHRLQPREMYRDNQCKKCGKINSNVISAVGLPPLDLSSIRLDYFKTKDGFTVVSASFAQFLKEMCGDAVKCLAIGETGYYLLQCRDHVAPPADSRLYTPIEPADPNDVFQVRGKRCPKCGRFRVVTYQPEALPFPEEFTIFAFDVEQPLYLATSICCSPVLAKQISARQFKGLRLIPIN